MPQPIFITGIGTGVGKTLVSAIITNALQADYWKPIQAGYENGTDSEWVRSMINSPDSVIHPETYKFKLAASPHIAAREERVTISLDTIAGAYKNIREKNDQLKYQGDKASMLEKMVDYGHSHNQARRLIIEGAGGILVPLSEHSFVIDLVKKLQAKVIIVSRNYLGSINHSLLTAQACKLNGLEVAGWIFNDQYLQYEDEISAWTGIPKIASIPYRHNPDRAFIAGEAERITPLLTRWL